MSWYNPASWVTSGLDAVGGRSALGGIGSGVAQLRDQLFEDRRKEGQLPGYADRQNSLNQAIAGAQGRTVGNAQLDANVLAQQNELLRQLTNSAAGQGPSVATQQFQRGLEGATNNQLAMARSGMSNQALAGRQAMQNVGQATQGMAGQAAQMRVQEQLAARDQLANLSNAALAQRLGAQQFNINAALQGRQMDDQYGLGLRGLELKNALGQQQGAIAGMGQPTQNQQMLGALGSLLPFL